MNLIGGAALDDADKPDIGLIDLAAFSQCAELLFDPHVEHVERADV
jgi:hypothetical protein